MMFGILVYLFIAVPILELALLVWIGQQLGIVPTVVLVIVTGAVGAGLARWQGLMILRRLREELGAGRMPAEAMFEGVLLLVAGAVLLTPGVVTDAVGFLIMVPVLRRWVARRVQAWAARRFRIVTIRPNESVKDAEVVSVRDPDRD